MVVRHRARVDWDGFSLYGPIHFKTGSRKSVSLDNHGHAFNIGDHSACERLKVLTIPLISRGAYQGKIIIVVNLIFN